MTIELQAMILQYKSMLSSHFLLEPFDIRAFKLNNLLTLITDEMIVVVLVKHIIIDGFVVPKMPCLTDANLTQKV